VALLDSTVVGIALPAIGRDVAKVSLRASFDMMRHKRPLVLLCASSLLFLTGMFSIQTVAVYYARDVLGNADLYIVMTVVQTVAMIAAAAVVPKAVEAVGKNRTYLVAGVIAAAAGVGVAVAPGSTPAIGIACFGVLGFGLGAINTLIFAFQADTVELRRVEERHPRRGQQLRRPLLHPQSRARRRRSAGGLHHRAGWLRLRGGDPD